MSHSPSQKKSNSKALALLASINADRDAFNKQKKELEAEMTASKNGMKRIQAGLKNNEIDQELIHSGTEHLSNASPSSLNPNKKNNTSSNGRKSMAVTANRASILSPTAAASAGGTGADALNPPIVIPTGARISDWVYTGPIESTPPVVKTMDIYETVRFVGRGAFGDVNLIKNLENNLLFADKNIYVEKDEDMPFYLEELKFLRLHRHPSIIDVSDGFITAQPRVLHIIMPYAEGGDMAKYISNAKKNNTKITETQIIKWSMQLALALHFLHETGAIHRDLKPSNVMLTEGGELIKLVDFGLAYKCKDGDYCNNATEVGTPYYTPPEMIEGKPYSYPSDCWSFGVLLYELLTFSLPFKGKDTNDLVKAILTGSTPVISSDRSIEIRNICYGLLNKDPNKRLGMAGVLLNSTFNPRVVQFPQGYRPKSLEERVKRVQIRQLTAQVEMLSFSKKSSMMSVTDCLPVIEETITHAAATLDSIDLPSLEAENNSPRITPKSTPKVTQTKRIEKVELPQIKSVQDQSNSDQDTNTNYQPPPEPEGQLKAIYQPTPPPILRQGSNRHIGLAVNNGVVEDIEQENIISNDDEIDDSIASSSINLTHKGGIIGDKIQAAIQEAQSLSINDNANIGNDIIDDGNNEINKSIDNGDNNVDVGDNNADNIELHTSVEDIPDSVESVRAQSFVVT